MLKSLCWIGIVSSILAFSACGTADPSEKSFANNGDTTNNGDRNNGGLNNGVEPDMGAVDDMDQPPSSNIPDRITTAGAEFSGAIESADDVVVKLTANEGDRVVIRLTKDEGSTWDPSLVLYRETDASPLTYSDPEGDTDATIPWKAADLATGFEFWYAGTYDLVLENRSDDRGPFHFTLECLSGPCKSQQGDFDADGIPDGTDNCESTPNASQADADGDGVGDYCDSDSSYDPFPGLSNAALVERIQTDKAAGHLELDYRDAREYMFGTADNVNGFVECVYTGTMVETVGIPPTTVMNAEHTWPQSRGGDLNGAESDLHHLFPVTAGANIQRSNLYFGAVVNPTWSEGGSERGKDSSGDTRFEPRDSQKGDAARAVFYVSAMYGLDVDAREEALLRQWHAADPVSEVERRRNQYIANFQKSRNPFVDFPKLVDRISNF